MPNHTRHADPAIRHSSLSIALHWLTALLVILAMSLGWWREAAEGDAWRASLLELHRTVGLCIFVLSCLRLGVRWRYPVPAVEGRLLERWAVHLVHGLLYGLLFALPLVGYLQSSASGSVVAIVPGLSLPRPIGLNLDLAEDLQDWHAGLAWALLVLVGLHACAALWHHWVRRDGTLRRMLPLLRARP